MKFKYKAPVEYNDLTSGWKWVESEYRGPHDIKVGVDRQTRKPNRGVEFDHDGYACHGGTNNSNDEVQWIYLHSHNPNHIALMAMICNHEDHATDTIVETVYEKYNVVYQRFEHPTLDHTYSMQDVTIDRFGRVTYPWFKLDSQWDQLVRSGKAHIADLKRRLRTDLLTTREEAKIEYCIQIVQELLDNEVCKNHPWKLTWPSPDTVTLDNTHPIGLPDGVPNPPKSVERTYKWGAVEHECADHPDVIEAVCPNTVAETEAIEPWPVMQINPCTHAHKVSHYLEHCEQCKEADPDVDLNDPAVHDAHHAKWCEECGYSHPEDSDGDGIPDHDDPDSENYHAH
jgi:hypothetical protein